MAMCQRECHNKEEREGDTDREKRSETMSERGGVGHCQKEEA